MPSRPSFLAIAAFAIALPWSAATAAPQVLGLVASNGTPTPLICSGRECSAHFSAFCLQEAHEAPASGTAYAPAPASEVTLVARTADGRTLRLPGERYLSFNSQIGFTSVRISLPRGTLTALGATEAAVEVGPAASLIPAALVGTADPVAAEEIALATGPMRDAASRMFEAPGAASDAARIVNLLINDLPADPRAAQPAGDAPWDAAAIHPTAAAATTEGIQLAREIYDGCGLAVASGSIFTLRSCLELRHADLMATTNHRFWDSVGGS